jgi:hypothetical protein
MSSPGQISLAAAVKKISKRLAVSADDAQQKLIKAAAAGAVRSSGVSQLWQYRRQPIRFHWYPRETLCPTKFNLLNDSISNITDGEITRVEIDDEDLEYWMQGMAPSASKATPDMPANKRGKFPFKTMAAKEAMLKDLREGRITPEQLKKDTGATMVANYGNSIFTCTAARKAALSDFLPEPRKRITDK